MYLHLCVLALHYRNACPPIFVVAVNFRWLFADDAAGKSWQKNVTDMDYGKLPVLQQSVSVKLCLLPI